MTLSVEPETYRDRISAALGAGWRFADLHANSRATRVRTLLVAADGSTMSEEVKVRDGEAPSIVDLIPAAGWDEREAHDLQSVRFPGHEPLRPLVDHGADLSEWTVPVHGRDTYQVAVGPIHAGVIESGHFRFHVVGDRIFHLDTRLFYKHRGLERAAEGATLERGEAFVARACAACSVANGVAYALACEQALGLRTDPELSRVRTTLLELERVWNLLNDIAAICAGVGMAAANQHFGGLTERARRLNAKLSGHRFLFGCIRTGGSALTIPAEQLRDLRAELRSLQIAASRGWRELSFNASFQDRLPGIGIVDAESARRLGTVGPAARAAGLREDVRMAAPRLAYKDFTPVIGAHEAGDVQDRFEQRFLELQQAFGLLEPLLQRPFEPAAAHADESPATSGVGRVESPRGATTCIVERAGDRIVRLRLRTGSYANWPSVAHAGVGNMLPDFPLINKSFELCYACSDR